MKRILLVGGRAPAALALARAFRSRGLEVYLAETTAWCLCGVSDAVTRFECLPWPNVDPHGWAEALVSLVRRERIDLVVPTFEEVFHVAREQRRLAPHCSVFASDLATLARLHSKWEFVQRTRELGFDVPRTALIVSNDAARSAVAQDPDIVLKPVWSRFSSDVLLPPWNEAKLARATATLEQPWVAQERIAGRLLCSYGVARHGTLVAHTVYPAEFTAGGGTAIAFRHLDHPRCLEWIRQFVDRERFHGQIAFDFIEEDGGRLLAIECNPRATNGVTLFEDHSALAGAILGDEAPLVEPSAETRVMLALPMLVALAHHWGQRGEDLRGTYRASRDATWDEADPLPLVMQFLGPGWMYWRKLRYGVSLRRSATFDLEWNGR